MACAGWSLDWDGEADQPVLKRSSGTWKRRRRPCSQNGTAYRCYATTGRNRQLSGKMPRPRAGRPYSKARGGTRTRRTAPDAPLRRASQSAARDPASHGDPKTPFRAMSHGRTRPTRRSHPPAFRPNTDLHARSGRRRPRYGGHSCDPRATIISPTPRVRRLIFEANRLERVPVFAHIPLIHGPDGAKLSKRHGALGVEAYRDMGYLPEAMRNYLARLGWSHGDDEFFTTEQAVDWFGLDGGRQSRPRGSTLQSSRT